MPDVTVSSHAPHGLPVLGDPAWARALNLVERAALGGEAAGEAEERALRRLARWRGPDPGWLPARLAALGEGWDEARLFALLAEPTGHLAERAGRVPEWWQDLERILGREEPPAAGAAGGRHSGVVSIVRPFVADALDRLRAELPRESVDGLCGDIGEALSRSLVVAALRTLVLELNVMRVSGRLRGDTPVERFGSFVEQLATATGRAGLFFEYPVLARLLARRTEQAVTAVTEVFRRWNADREAIGSALFAGRDPGTPVSIALGGGDTHGGGRAVAVLRFAGGQRLVYKPRPLGVHVRFGELLAWFDERIGGMGLRVPAALERDAYGWIEFVEPAECGSADEVADYYRRLGALLALLHAVEGADFHYENLIAHGAQPVLLDLEGLLHPHRLLGVDEADPASAALMSSVMRVGLLPIVLSGEVGELDMGGVGGDRGASLPFAAPAWEDLGTDTMRLVRTRSVFEGADNRPTLDGKPAEPTHFVEELVEGFTTGYRVVDRCRGELPGEDGLLAGFAGLEVRAILRPTQVYATLLDEGTHPDLLRDALDRDRFQDFLWAMSRHDSQFARLIPYEQAELWEGDVPIFHGRPDSRDLWTGRGERIAGYFAQSPLERVRAKQAGFGPVDRARQEWLIRASLATRPNVTATERPAAEAATHTYAPTVRPANDTPVAATFPPANDTPATTSRPANDNRHPSPATNPTADACLEAATRIGDRLAASAIRRDDRVSWLGLAQIGDAGWQVAPAGGGLYDGAVGIALFLARLGAVTGERRHLDLAVRALWNIPGLLDGPAGALGGAAGFAGLPGVAYGLMQIGACVGEDRVPPVADVVRLIAQRSTEGGAYSPDVLGGDAGTVAALLAVHAHTGSAQALEIALDFGARLVERAEPQAEGIGWRHAAHPQALVGFSHGAAGIGWALAGLAAVAGDGAMREAACAAFAYERAEYRPRWRNWPDYRHDRRAPDAPVSHMYGWCHGAPGIGLARADVLGLHDTYDTPALRADLRLALSATVHGAAASAAHCLCHGTLGNAELLLVARERGLADIPEPTGFAAAAIGEGPRCGTPQHIETPSLMTGLAGIGYGLLRLAAPERVPSVLLLRPPYERCGAKG
ncbi:type 2 lanthipeptide synthetase LanM family protein [Embleya sp. NPDC050493]|uniref:type 2 lanthipeptide synthetase LanM family protein n=1 Tax=Embleya sp. NPDC050493 TaxID=3363989 RepID=UPI0037B1F94B